MFLTVEDFELLGAGAEGLGDLAERGLFYLPGALGHHLDLERYSGLSSPVLVLELSEDHLGVLYVGEHLGYL